MFRLILAAVIVFAGVSFTAPSAEACGGLFAGRPLTRLGAAIRDRKPVRTLLGRAARGVRNAAAAVLGR